MEKEKVYLDSTIPSYYVSEPSRDIYILAHQGLTKEWWNKNKDDFEIYISDVVLEEIRGGNPQYARKREELVEGATVLLLDEEMRGLAQDYMRYFNFSDRLYRDMLHVAVSVCFEMNYLLTWNFTHLANGHIREQLFLFNERLGRKMPQIVTPEELMENTRGSEL
jgi:hypothetical protein